MRALSRAGSRHPEKRGVFSWPVRVYYQHTDAGGMVYHARFLDFMEAARSEWFASLGFDLGELARGEHVVFVVHSAQIAYHKPALLHDSLAVTTRALKAGPARLVLEQEILRAGEALASAQLTLACVDARSHRLVALPAAIRRTMEDAT